MKTIEDGFLPKEFKGVGEVKNKTFKQIAASEFAYVYAVIDDETKRVKYEVFKRVFVKPSIANIKGREVVYSGGEYYPKSAEFGVRAWHFLNYNAAMYKYSILNQEMQNSQNGNTKNN